MSRNQSQNQNMRMYRPGMFQVGNFEQARMINSKAEPKKTRHRGRKLFVLLVFVLVAGAAVFHYVSDKITYQSTTDRQLSSVSSKLLPGSECSTNTQSKLIVVVLSQQHLWACNYNQVAYSSAVVTGYTGLAADVTPTGTYHIYAKETDVTLTGSDGVTSWSDPVSYWMPFLDNQYGAYGFHDATWRSPSQFGHISTSSPNASHGCVECPLATAKWLYGWTDIGTTIIIRDS